MPKSTGKRIGNPEIYDCTLREGEQMVGVSFTLENKIKMIRALDDFGVGYIEAGWPVASPETIELFHRIAGLGLKSKVVAFGSTSIADDVNEDGNLKAIIESRAAYACIFGKTWIEHVEYQLRITKEKNLEKIRDSIAYLKDNGLEVFYDAEHFFDGFKDNKDYALETLVTAARAGASRLILCDTNGGTLPDEILQITEETYSYLKEKGINAPLGIHCHDDSGLAVANSLIVLPYIKQIQCTVNGFGERVGNADLCALIPTLVKKKQIPIEVKLEKITELSVLFYDLANLPRQMRQPYVSARAFSHKGGVHIDAIVKGASYQHITPGDVGAEHELTLNSLGGAACVVATAEKFGYVLDKKDPETRGKITLLLRELSELEKQGYDLGNIEAEQYMIIERYFGSLQEPLEINSWEVKTNALTSSCSLSGKVNGAELDVSISVEGGPVDAAYKAMSELIGKKYNLNDLRITDFKVRIVNQEGERSKVRTRIEFSDTEVDVFTTVGISDNIIESSIEALKKGFQYYINRNYEG